MKQRGTFRTVRLAVDAATGLVIFLLVAGALSGALQGLPLLSNLYAGEAQAAHIATGNAVADLKAAAPQVVVPRAMITGYPGQVFRGTDRTTAYVVLGLVFTLLFAANVALYRHLRSQYSTPRRRKTSRNIN